MYLCVCCRHITQGNRIEWNFIHEKLIKRPNVENFWNKIHIYAVDARRWWRWPHWVGNILNTLIVWVFFDHHHTLYIVQWTSLISFQILSSYFETLIRVVSFQSEHGNNSVGKLKLKWVLFWKGSEPVKGVFSND